MDDEALDLDRYEEEEAMLAQEAEIGAMGPSGSARPAKRAFAGRPDPGDGPLARSLAFASQESRSEPSPAKRVRPAEEPEESADAASDGDPSAGQERRAYLLPDPSSAPLTLPVVLPESGLYRYLEVRGGEEPPASGRVGGELVRAAEASREQSREAMRVLLHCVDADRRRRARRAAVEAASRRAAAEAEEEDGEASAARSGSGAEAMTEKWTDLYAPRSFPQLLSSERTNRNVLRWVKMWQGHAERAQARREAERQGRAEASTKGRGKGARLLGMGPRAKGKGKAGAASSSSSSSSEGGAGAAGGGSGLVGVKTEVLEERERLRGVFGAGWNLDARVLLLVGPAGVGKTMLAHIAGRQAGLEVMELNASDDRSAGRLGARLAAAMQMRSLTAGGRGRLVILDEVDGLDSGAVELLVRMIGATPPVVPTPFPWRAPGSGGAPGGRRRRRGASAAPPLSCPVICTCNELYAPSLRKLREHCQVIEMRRPAQERLAGLLRTICREQGMTPTQEGVAALSERCGYDIRACINTLQTVPKRHGAAARAGAPFRLTPELVRGLPVGSKDDTRSAFDVWASVFTGHQGKRSAGRLRRGAAPTGNVAEAASAFAAVAAAAAAVRRREAGAGQSASERAAAVARGEADDDDEALELPSTALNVPAITAAIRASASGAASGSAPTVQGAQGAWPRTGPQSFTRFLLQDLSSRGVDVQLLLDGLHENYPSSPHTDPGMGDAARAADWLSVGDLFSQGARRTQTYGLNRMAAVCGAGVHWNAASDRPGHRLRPRWPAQRRRLRTERQEREEVLRSFMGGRMRTGCGLGARNGRSLVLETLSPLLTLAAPPLRERNTGLLNSRERRDMADAVAVMATNGLVYARERAPLGGGAERGEGGGWSSSAPRLVLRPPVDSLVRFEGYDPYERGHRAEMAEVMKELLSQEVRLAGVRLRAARAERAERREARRAERRAAAGGGRGGGGGGGGGAAEALMRAGQGAGADEASDGSGSDEDEGGGPAEVAALIQEALSGGRRRRKDLGSGKDVQLPEHVRRQMHEAATGESAPSPSDAKKAFASPGTERAAKAQGFLAQLRKKHTRRADNRVAPRKRFPIYFKFQEGFTDAVRRPVTLKDLLG